MSKYETFSSRIKAKMLDFFLVIIPLLIILIIVSSVLSEFKLFQAIGEFNFFILPLLSLMVFYPVVAHILYGQTIGKKFANLKVVDISEKPLIFGQAILRSMPQIAFLMLIFLYRFQDANNERSISSSFYWGFTSFYFLFRITDHVCGNVIAKNRTLHDLLGKTVVIRTDV